MKFRAQYEGLAIRGTVETGDLPKDTLMAITGNATVDKGGANAHCLGRLTVPAKNADEEGTIETRYKEMFDIKASGALAAGEFWKLGAPDGTTGENTAAKFVPGTDAEERKCGVVWIGASSGGTATVLAF